MKKILILLIIFSAATLSAQEIKWQESDFIANWLNPVADNDDIEIYTKPGVIIVKVKKETFISLYTILGKPLGTQNLEPGIYEMPLNSHGVFIVKTEGSSCKISL